MPKSEQNGGSGRNDAPWPIRVLKQLLVKLIQALKGIFDLVATLILWLLELATTALVRIVQLVSQVCGVVLNLLIWSAQCLLKPLLGSANEQSPQAMRGYGLRLTGLAIGAYFLAALLPALIPPQFQNPLWYLNICRAVVGNGVILVFALFCLIVALNGVEQTGPMVRTRSKTVWVSQGSVGLFLLMLPLQLGGSLLLVNQIRASSNSQLSTVEARRDLALQQVGRQADPAALLTLFRRFNPPPITQPSASLPLPKLRQEVALALSASAETAKAEINRQRRSRLLNLSVDSVRTLLSLLALASASLGLSRWGGTSKESLS